MKRTSVPDPELRVDAPPGAARTLALAHGAGAGMATPYMDFFAQALAGRGLRVVRFEFPYMAQARAGGKKAPPNPLPVLRATWLKVIDQLGHAGLIIGGKSMGGRIASLVADEAGVAGLVCLGYPFHPVAKPDRLRVEHLQSIKTPTLIVQGERDPFGDRADVAGYALAAAVRIAWLPDGDHDLKPRQSSGATQRQTWEAAVEEIDRFVAGLAQ